MTEKFSKAVAKLTEDYYVKILRQSLNEILGPSGAKAVIYYLGGAETLKDPKILQDKLEDLFGPGAETIPEHILKNLKE